MAWNKGDIVLIPFPYAEQTATKTRPALVINGQAFMKAEGRLIVAAITSNVSAHRNVTSHPLRDWTKAGLKKPSVVTAWLATISPRLVQLKIGRLTHRDLAKVEDCLKAALEL